MSQTCSNELTDEIAAEILLAAKRKAQRFMQSKRIHPDDVEDFACELVRRAIRRLCRWDGNKSPLWPFIGSGMRDDAISLMRIRKLRFMKYYNIDSLDEMLERLNEDSPEPTPRYLQLLRDQLVSGCENLDLVVDVRNALAELSDAEKRFLKLLIDNGTRKAAQLSGLSCTDSQRLLCKLRSKLSAYKKKQK